MARVKNKNTAWMFDDVGFRAEDIEPPPEFPLFDETIQVDFCCPRCRYPWSGNPKPGAEEVQGDFS